MSEDPETPSIGSRLRALADNAAATAARVTSSPRFVALQPSARLALALLLVGYLAYCLIPLGLTRIWESRPSSWLFYALLPLSFLPLPAGDLIVFRRLWRTGRPLVLSVIMRRHVVNAALVELSGEAYLYVWGRRHLALPHSYLFQTIKDSSLLSAIASWSFFLGLLVFLAASGHWMIPFVAAGDYRIYLAAIAFLVLLLAALLLTRRGLAVLDRGQIAFTFGVHMARVLVSQGLTITLWALAMPEVPLMVWLNFLLLRDLVMHLGFLFRRDLLNLTAGVGIAGFLGLSQPAIAALLVTITAADYLMYLLVLGLPSLVTSLRAMATPRRAN